MKIKLVKIKSITRKEYDKSIPVYCINVEPYHRIIVNNYLSKQSVNFQLEFGASGFSFAESVLTKEWELKDIDEYIKKNHLQKKVHDLMIRKADKTDNGFDLQDYMNTLPKDFYKYWAVASDIRAKFFRQYSGLKEWIVKTVDEAMDNGYVRSPFGAIRRLPQLTCVDKSAEAFHNKVKNLQNIALNSPVQNVEMVLINYTMNEVGKFIKQNNLKTRLKVNVHDAIIHATYKPEIDKIKEFEYNVFSMDRPENNGIPMVLESNIADPVKGEVWGYGHEI